MSERAQEGPRRLAKVLSGCVSDWPVAGALATITAGSGWEPIIGGTQLVQRDYFDLSGYNMDQLTVYFQGVELQTAEPVTTQAPPSSAASMITLITTQLITDAEIVASLLQPFSNIGFTGSTTNQEQIVFGQSDTYSLNTTLVQNILSLLSRNTWGTCAATTTSRLHITRIILNHTPLTTLEIPDVNVVLMVIVGKEDVNPYMMRTLRGNEPVA